MATTAVTPSAASMAALSLPTAAGFTVAEVVGSTAEVEAVIAEPPNTRSGFR